MQPRYLSKKPRRGRGKAKNANQKIVSGEEKGLTVITHAQRRPAGWAGTEDDSRELCFPRKCLPSSRVRADAVSLPHLSSPLPVPLRVLVPGWCFLVAAAAVSMCVTDPPAARGRGTPARPPSLPLGCGASACPLSGLVSLVLPLLRAGCSSWPLSRVLPHAAQLSGWGVRFSLPGQGRSSDSKSSGRPWPRWGWRFCLLYFLPSPNSPDFFGKPVSPLDA